MSIRSGMYRMVAILIILPFLLFSLIIVYIYSDEMENVITESLSAVSNAQVEEMTDFCLSQKNYFEMIGSTDVSMAAMDGKLNADMLSYLENILYAHVQAVNYLKSIAIIDSDYRVVASTEAHDIYAGEKLISLVENMGENAFFISNVLTDTDSPKQDKTLAAILRVENGSNTVGYVLANLSCDFYQDIRKRARLWNESTFYLLDGNNQIISAGTPLEERTSFITSPEEREDYQANYDAIDFDANPKGSFSYKLGNKDYITYYSNIEYTDWRIMLTVNMSNYRADQTVYRTLIYFLIVLCAILAVWIGAFTSRRIMKPVGLISGTLDEIKQKQDYSLRIDIERMDEVGILATEINELLDFIETENLYEANQRRLLQQKADQDALTKVLNRERIMQHLNEAVERCKAGSKSIAVLFVDIDDFKSFNTNYGHSVGDQVLLFFASLLARETNGAIGRLGGDEFLVVMEEAESVSSLSGCLDSVRKASNSQFVMRGNSVILPVTCCIGAVRVDYSRQFSEEPAAERIVDMADDAMYRAKNDGKHRYIILDYNECKGLTTLKLDEDIQNHEESR